MIKEIAEFLRKQLPKDKIHQQQQQEHVIPKIDVVSEQTLSKQTSFSQRRFDVPSSSDTNFDVYGAKVSPFFSPNTRLLDTQYGILNDGANLKICNSTVIVDNSSNMSIRGKQLEGTEDLWKLLTRLNEDNNSIDKNDLHKYKTILETINAHLVGYKAGGNIQTSQGIKFRNVIAKLFPVAEVASRQQWVTY